MNEKAKRLLSSHLIFEEEYILRRILSFLPNTFRYTAAVNKKFQAIYAAIHDDSKITTFENAIQTVGTVRIYLADGGDAATVASLAARGGKLDVLNAIHSEGHEITGLHLCHEAAKEGHLEILQWLRSIGCNWNSNTCSAAALNGHLEVLKWARANGCNWNSGTCSHAAAGGHFEVLQWAQDNGCDYDAYTLVLAANHGGDLLQWAINNGYGYSTG